MLSLLLFLTVFPVHVRAEEEEAQSEETLQEPENAQSLSGNLQEEPSSLKEEGEGEEESEALLTEEEPKDSLPDQTIEEQPDTAESDREREDGSQALEEDEESGLLYGEESVSLAEYSRDMAVDPAISLQVEEAFAAGFAEEEERIDVSNFQIPYEGDVIGDYYYLARKHYPEYFYVGNEYRFYTDGEIIYSVEPKYEAVTQEMKDAFTAAADALLAGIGEDMPEEEKALIIHDRLVLLNEYDKSGKNHTAYHALVENLSVCEGYAMAYYYLCRRAGIPCDYVKSKDLNHEWNTVTIGGKVYFLDATWDDPTGTYRNICSHENFLCSQKLFARDHESTDWLNTYGENIYGVYDNTDFDEIGIRDSLTPAVHLGSQIYYMKKDSTSLFVHDFSSDTDTIAASFRDEHWTPGGSARYPECFWGLAASGEDLYVSSPKRIYHIAENGEPEELYVLSKQEAASGNIYGIRIQGNTLTYRINRTYEESSFISEGTIELIAPEEEPSELLFTLEKTELYPGESVQGTVTILPETAKEYPVTFVSDQPGIAEADDKGLVTAKAPGTALITASIPGKEITAKAAITVLTPAESIVITDRFSEIMLYDKRSIQYTVLPAEADDKSVTFTSSNPDVLSVDPKEGMVYALGEGSAVITVTSNYDESIQDSLEVTVFFQKIETIDFLQEEVILARGRSAQLRFTTTPEKHSDRNISFTSDHPEVVSVSREGIVTAHQEGRAVITAEAAGGARDTITVIAVPDGIWAEPNDEPEEGYVYTGEAIKPGVIVYDSGVPLKESQDYTLSYKNNKAAGTGEIIVNLRGNYGKKGTQTFAIRPVDLNSEDIRADAVTLAETGKALKLTPKVYWKDKALKLNTDYEIDLSGWNLTDPGDHEIFLVGKGNFAGRRSLIVHVAEKEEKTPVSKLSITAKSVTKTPGEDLEFFRDILPKVTIKNGRYTYEDPASAFSFKEISHCNEAGTCSFTLVPSLTNEEFTGERTIPVKITGTALSKAKAEVQSLEYNGTYRTVKDAHLRLTLASGSQEYVLEENRDYVVLEHTYTNNLNAGKASVTLKGINAFSGTMKVSFTIQTAKQAGLVNYEEEQPYVKGGCTPRVTIEGLKEGKDYKVTYKNNKKIGTRDSGKNAPTLVVKYLGNYKGVPDFTGNFSILPSDLSTVTAEAEDVVWSSKKGNFIPKITLTDIDGKKLSAGTDYSKTFRYFNLDTGEEITDLKATLPLSTRIRAEISESGKGNYVGTAIAYYRLIRKDDSIVSAEFRIADQEYTGEEILLTKEDFLAAGLKGHDRFELGEQFEIAGYEGNLNKGTAKVILRGINECGGTRTVSFQIKERSADRHWIIVE